MRWEFEKCGKYGKISVSLNVMFVAVVLSLQFSQYLSWAVKIKFWELKLIKLLYLDPIYWK